MVIVVLNDKAKVVRGAKLPISDRALDDFFGTFTEPVQAVMECTSFYNKIKRRSGNHLARTVMGK